MSELSISRNYSQSPSEVFAALNDFAGIHRFHPLLTRSPLVEGTPASGAGSERVCHLHDGNTLHERLVDAKPDEWLKIEVVDSSSAASSRATSSCCCRPWARTWTQGKTCPGPGRARPHSDRSLHATR